MQRPSLEKIAFHDDYFHYDEYHNGLYHPIFSRCDCSLARIIMNEMDKPGNEETIDPSYTYPALDDIIEKMKILLPTFSDEEKLREWYTGLYRTDYLKLQDLVKIDAEGNRDLSLLIAHNYFIETVIRVFKTRRTAGELLRSNIVKDINAVEKAKLLEEDKKYKPRFAEREAVEKAKATAEEKKIKEFVEKFGISREAAEKIVFKAKPAEPISTKPSDTAKRLGLSQEDINKLILGK